MGSKAANFATAAEPSAEVWKREYKRIINNPKAMQSAISGSGMRRSIAF